jgi:hypothetical protein
MTDIMNLKIFLILAVFIFLVSCSNKNKSISSAQFSFETDSISVKLKYSDVYFIVPSPIQTSMLLKNCGIGYQERLTHSITSLEMFTTTTKKALALGVLGADLSYLNLYEQKEKAIKNLQMAESILDDLEISPSLNKDLLKKLGNNFGNNDSVLFYLSEIYRSDDLYLKAIDRRDICSLIIAGGWIESFYFLTELYKETQKEKIFDLILFQSDILDNLIKLLSPFYEKSTEFTELIDDLVNIAYQFDVVDKTLSVTSVKTDTMHHKTNINNQTQHILTGSKLEHLGEIVLALRNKTVQQ